MSSRPLPGNMPPANVIILVKATVVAVAEQ